MIGAIIFGLIAVGIAVLGIRQLLEKGFLFNNAYIYASEKERETMNKKPYYRQSGIVFLLIAATFAINAVAFLLQSKWLFIAVLGVLAGTLIYAVVSAIRIGKSK